MNSWVDVRWRLVRLLGAVVIALLILPALPVAAEEQVTTLPPVNNFATARFDLLSTVEVGGLKLQSFGKGAAVLPDRISLWVSSSDGTQVSYAVQIGTAYYTNDGSGWKRADDLPLENAQALPVSAQFNQIQQYASAILKIGPETVRGTPTTHYQVWISGARLFEISGDQAGISQETRDLLNQSTFKYDFWIGDTDGFLHQQNSVLMLPSMTVRDQSIPASTFSTLITYYDINDPNIAVHAPI